MLNSSFYGHINTKLRQSCQIQAPAVMSANFNSFSQYNLFLLTAKWLVCIQEQLAPVDSFLLSVKWLVRSQEQLVPVNLLSFLLSVKWLVRSQEQLVPMLFVSVISQTASSNTRTACAHPLVNGLGQVPSSSQKNNLHLSICCLFP